jgi:ribonucleoside-diphosphate reductase alpha chain
MPIKKLPSQGQAWDMANPKLSTIRPQLSETALDVLARRYLLKDSGGDVVESPPKLFWRVAWHVAKAEAEYPESPWHEDVVGLAVKFYDLMATGRFLPNSPTLMNAGTDMGQLAACFVLPVEDSMEGIFSTVMHAALVHQTGGGTGFSFSRLRPQGARVRSTQGVASGPVSFARVFDIATEQVKQGGKRRGANMGVLRIDHPDIVEFIQAKDEPGMLENFNLSVGVTNEFMEALTDRRPFALRDPATMDVVKEVDPEDIWSLLVGSAWKRGDPGVLFLDTINADNPTPDLGKIEATNPCVTGDTMVTILEPGVGPKDVRIEDILGEQVEIWAMGKDGAERYFTTTDKGFFSTGRKHILHVRTREGHILRLTPDHLVGTLPMNHSIAWKEAHDLQPGDKIRTETGGADNPSGEMFATVAEIYQYGTVEVFDVQVPGANCFFANGLLVHNCGEVPLLPYEACNLGSINLAAYCATTQVVGRKIVEIDMDSLLRDVSLCVRFLDNVIDVGKYPLPQIEDAVRATRKIGLGCMGVADMLFQLGIPYNSQKAVDFCANIWNQVNIRAWEESATLAKERGKCPALPGCKYRNATISTVAPTGTLSIIAGCSSGIEPAFSLAFERRIMDDDVYREVNPVFLKTLKASHPDTFQDILDSIIAGERLQDNFNVHEKIRDVFVTAMDIEPVWHLQMQAVFQAYTSNAVSKTINLPYHASREQVDEIYRTAWEKGCKGVTIFRDGCRGQGGQVLSTTGASTPKEESPATPATREPRQRPDELHGVTRRMKTGLGTLYLTVNEMDGRPFEVFATIAKSGRSAAAKAEAVGRLVSLALRSGISVEEIVKQIEGIGGEYQVFREKGLVLSIPDAVAQMLKKWTDRPAGPPATTPSFCPNQTCPDCGHPLAFKEGCQTCESCGWTKCGG